MNQATQKDIETLDGLVVKQAIRDIASKHPKTSNEAKLYFESKDFTNLCKRNELVANVIVHAVRELDDYPILSKKKLAEDICNLVDNFFRLGIK